MLDFVFRLMLTTGATFWMVIVFGIKEHWTLCIFPAEVIGIALMMVPIALSGIAFLMSRFFNRDSIQNCTDCVLLIMIFCLCILDIFLWPLVLMILLRYALFMQLYLFLHS